MTTVAPVAALTRALLALCLLPVTVVAAPADEPDPGLPLRTIADVPLTGGPSRWDYESLDGSRHLLFIAHLGDSAVTVFNTQTSKVVADLPHIGDVHGVLVVPFLDRVYASATRTNEVVVIDETSLKVMAHVPAGTYPDGMAYAPDVHKLYVSDETSGMETVIDTSSNVRVATIALGGEAGNTQYDPRSKHIFVNVQTIAQLVEIDPVTDKVMGRYEIAGAHGNHGLLIEPSQDLAFIACEDNDRLIVFDLARKRVAASFDVGPGPDVLAWDPAWHVLYVAGEGGIVSLFKAEAGQVTKQGEGKLGPNAHSVAVDPASHRAYFPLKDLDGKPALRIVAPLVH